MRWKEILTGALITLFVSIVGGIIVYYVTVQRPEHGEKLVYEAEPAFFFASQKAQEGFVVVKARNNGGAAAHNVAITISYPPPIHILDHSVSFSSGSANALSQDSSSDQQIALRIASLMPGEEAVISVMLAGTYVGGPAIAVRSDGSIGTPGSVDVNPGSSSHPLRAQFLSNLLPILAGLQIFILFTMRGRLSRLLGRVVPTSRSLNNTAFLYLHSGLEKEAEKMLRAAIWKGGADSLMLANYGLALGLKGEIDAALKHIGAAEFYTAQSHEKAVVLFNLSLVHYLEGRVIEADQEIRDAVNLSNEVKRYIRFSKLVKTLSASNASLGAFVLTLR